MLEVTEKLDCRWAEAAEEPLAHLGCLGSPTAICEIYAQYQLFHLVS